MSNSNNLVIRVALCLALLVTLCKFNLFSVKILKHDFDQAFSINGFG